MVFNLNRREVFCMEYELKHYYRVKYALVCARQSFLKEPPKDDFEEYAKKIIDRAYFMILNKIDELNRTNERLLEYFQKHIEKCIKLWYNIATQNLTNKPMREDSLFL